MKLLKIISKLRSKFLTDPYNFWQQHGFIKIDNDISDQFFFCLDGMESVFIAENSLAITLNKEINCTHVLSFFDLDGNLCGRVEQNTSLFHIQINIDFGATGGVLKGTFCHHIVYADSIVSGEFKKIKTDFGFQHRGYCGYRCDSKLGYSFVHGNFGGIFNVRGVFKSIARQAATHTYFPQFILKKDLNYELVFINPTQKKLNFHIKIFKKNYCQLDEKITINSFGCFIFKINQNINYDQSLLSWTSKLPIGRAIVFERRGKQLNVFHS